MSVTIKVTQCSLCCADGNMAGITLRLRNASLAIDDKRYIDVIVHSVTKNANGSVSYEIEYDNELLVDPEVYLTASDFDLVCIDYNAEYAIEVINNTTYTLETGPADSEITLVGIDAVNTTIDLCLAVQACESVTSVNAQSGVVVLDPDDLDDTSTTNKFVQLNSGWSTTNSTLTKTFDANSTTLNELADVVATLIETLKNGEIPSA